MIYILVGLRVKWYSFLYTSCVSWNKLPGCIQEIQDDSIFRSEVKKMVVLSLMFWSLCGEFLKLMWIAFIICPSIFLNTEDHNGNKCILSLTVLKCVWISLYWTFFVLCLIKQTNNLSDVLHWTEYNGALLLGNIYAFNLKGCQVDLW